MPSEEGVEHARRALAKGIRLMREKRGLSLQEASERIGVSKPTLMKWEKGQGSLWTGVAAGVDWSLFTKIGEAYRCKLKELLPPRNNYPSAPVDPVLRLEWVRRRNASISGYEPDEYMAIIAEQEERRAGRAPETKTHEPVKGQGLV